MTTKTEQELAELIKDVAVTMLSVRWCVNEEHANKIAKAILAKYDVKEKE